MNLKKEKMEKSATGGHAFDRIEGFVEGEIPGTYRPNPSGPFPKIKDEGKFPKVKESSKPKHKNRDRSRRKRKNMIDRLAKRDKGMICMCCEIVLTYETVTLDHVIPKSHGGPNTFSNYVLACLPCNTSRGNPDPNGT